MQLILPNVEHRFCARHMYVNWKKENNGHDMQQLFWACCKATTEAEFHKHSARMATLKDTALSSLLKRDPKHWSKALFQTHSKCDVVDNNFGEAFNSSIISARSVMPKISKLVENHKATSAYCHVTWNGQNGFEPGRPGQMLVRRPNTRSHATLFEPLISSQPAPLSQQSESTHPVPVHQPAVMFTAPSTSTNYGKIIHKLLPRRRPS
ncbi:hypothetical protein V6N13_024575 [Hibiscus sabdariffa]